MKKPHYAWLVCIGCALLLFCTSGLTVNAFTVYQPFLLRDGNLTNAQSSMLITVRSLFSFLGMLLTGWYYQKLSLRTGMLVSGLTVAFSFLVYGLASTYPGYLAAASLAGIGYGFGTMIPVAIMLEHWFVKERTVAIGICSAVTGLTTLGIPSLLTACVTRYGLRASFFGESAVIVLMILLCFLLVRDRPENLDMRPYGYGEVVAGQQNSARHESGLKRSDWFLIVPMLLLLGGFTNVGYSHLAVHMNALGFQPSVTALGITVSGVLLMAGKAGYGFVADRLGNVRTNWIFAVFLILGLFLCCVTGNSIPMLFTAMCTYGFGLGLTTVGMTAWVGDWSAEDQYDTNTRRFQLGYAGGTLVFSSLPGILADRTGGSYVPAYQFFFLPGSPDSWLRSHPALRRWIRGWL